MLPDEVRADILTRTECAATGNKGAQGVLTQIKAIEAAFPLRGFDCDNGSEFLNRGNFATFQYSTGSGSRLRHKYQVATERQGVQGAAISRNRARVSAVPPL